MRGPRSLGVHRPEDPSGSIDRIRTEGAPRGQRAATFRANLGARPSSKNLIGIDLNEPVCNAHLNLIHVSGRGARVVDAEPVELLRIPSLELATARAVHQVASEVRIDCGQCDRTG